MVGLAAQTQPGGCVEGCHAEGESGEAVASDIDAECKGGQGQSGEHEADELGESRRPSILQLGWRSDPRPDDTGEDLRPQRPLKTHERGERKDGDLGGEQAETQWPGNVNDEQHDGEHARCGPGAESQEARIDMGAERARANTGAARSEPGHHVIPSRCWRASSASRASGHHVIPSHSAQASRASSCVVPSIGPTDELRGTASTPGTPSITSSSPLASARPKPTNWARASTSWVATWRSSSWPSSEACQSAVSG